MKTFEDFRSEQRGYFAQIIKEIEEKLSYTKQTVRRKELMRERMFWQSELDETNSIKMKFLKKYPNWHTSLIKD